MIDKNVRPDQIFDRVQNARVMHKLVSPVEQQIGFRFLWKVQRMADTVFKGFQVSAEPGYFAAGQNRHRRNKTVRFVVSHIGV